jgi:ribosomal protein S18 acetylase RimI-like enzyme
MRETTMAMTMTDTQVRPLTTADIPTVRTVLREANRALGQVVSKPIFDAYLADVLDLEARLDISETFVAEHRGRVVGTITYFRDANDEGIGPRVPPGTAGIRAVATHPDARGLGLGRRLAETAVERARADGRDAIVLHTWMLMSAAIGLYESLGFRRAPSLDAGTREFFATGVEEDIPALAFRLDLRGRKGA